MTPVDAAPPKRLRELIAPIYFPWFAMAIGTGVLLLALPLYLIDQGLSFTSTSVVLAASGMGAFLGALPAGALIGRLGSIRTLAIAVAVVAASIALTAASGQPWMLAALQFAVGMAANGMRLAGQSFITTEVERRVRGKALANMGGIRRIGVFIGPLVGGFLIDSVGFGATFVLSGLLTALGVIPALVLERSSSDRPTQTLPKTTLSATIRRHWRLLLVAATGPLLIVTARRGRSVVLPLIADSLGMSATETGLVVAISTGADLLLFPVSGFIMDRFGRLFSIVPAFTLMAIGLFVLGTVDTTLGVVIAGGIIGFGNGLSAGSLMTIGSDLAPREAPGPFLAAFSALHDSGQVAGPLIVGVLADAAGLGAAAVALGVVLLIGLGVVFVTIGETASAHTGPASASDST